MMMKYDKYKLTVTGRLDGDDDKMTLFVPWNQLEDEVAIYLDNCKVITIDGGMREKREDD